MERGSKVEKEKDKNPRRTISSRKLGIAVSLINNLNYANYEGVKTQCYTLIYTVIYTILNC